MPVPDSSNQALFPERAVSMRVRLFAALVVVGVGGYFIYAQTRPSSGPSSRRSGPAGLLGQCLEDAPDPSAVAYENDARRAYKLYIHDKPANSRYMLLGRGDGESGAARLPHHWYEIRERGAELKAKPNDAVLFMHERQAAGKRRLIVVTGGPGGNATATRVQVRALVLDPGGPKAALPTFVAESRGPLIEDRTLATGDGLRVFAGQPDPKDQSKFSIVYEVDGQRRTINGQLRIGEGADERVVMTVQQ